MLNNLGLSIVVTSRNDDHGGEMLQRMSIFVRALDHQAVKYGLNAELVFVEWNPLPDRPFLVDVLPSPSKGSPLIVRYIRVPEADHNKWPNADRIPLFQMIGKNVGIRRAKADFVLATNVDLLFSDALCEWLAGAELDANTMYRANRCDVPASVMDTASFEDQLNFCRQNIIARHGFVAQKQQAKRSPLRRVLRGVKRWLRGAEEPPSPASLVDTSACGDFTLMARSAWEKIRGYPEIGLYSIYVDALGCHSAVACGIKQEILPPEMCAYHIDHSAGWMSMGIAEKIRETTIKPALDYCLAQEAYKWMYEHKTLLPINDGNWGCAGDQFEEVVVSYGR